MSQCESSSSFPVEELHKCSEKVNNSCCCHCQHSDSNKNDQDEIQINLNVYDGIDTKAANFAEGIHCSLTVHNSTNQKKELLIAEGVTDKDGCMCIKLKKNDVSPYFLQNDSKFSATVFFDLHSYLSNKSILSNAAISETDSSRFIFDFKSNWRVKLNFNQESHLIRADRVYYNSNTTDSENFKFMSVAIEEAQNGVIRREGGPFGATIVRNGKIVCSAHNLVTSTMDVSAHAEVTVIRKACGILQKLDLSDCVLYTSTYPCCMCMATIIWSGIKRVYYAASSSDAADHGFTNDTNIYRWLQGNKDCIDLEIGCVDHPEKLRPFKMEFKLY